jgi:hypothetical protein
VIDHQRVDLAATAGRKRQSYGYAGALTDGQSVDAQARQSVAAGRFDGMASGAQDTS